ncbi:hypothetical protein SSX86_017167 [Deinandra increscens subsp. villosa]|uniref:Uncharacterized protein n=1 Tax=Deinandra increscens subsp. villosa TaxID=3103831 RepID=A0AAP0GWR8_9ASTR
MEMEGGIDPAAPLDYIELQIFPIQNRYEVYVCSSNRPEKAASGPLKQLLLHSPRVKDLSSKGSNTNFKILPPDSVNDAEWFTTTTLTRFLHILGSPDIISIGHEITQLEETKKFQLSLSLKAVVDIRSSVDSKNELLRAVDLRLTELKDEVIAAFGQVTSSRCSTKDISDLESFAHHFGAKDIRDLLQKFVEMNLFPTVEDTKGSIRYGVSPTAAQTERQTSTDNEISSLTSEDDQPSVDRCRAAKRSATPRRSASPMRRIQIGRSGSHRAPSLTIKSLNHFPVREKTSFQRYSARNSSDEDDNGPDKSAKKNVLRMSVKDKISLFESKQRDQQVDIPKSKKLLNTTVGPNKAVLRRWSSGMGENHTQNPENSPLSSDNIAPDPEPKLELESDGFIFENRVSSMTAENIKPHSPEREESCEKHPDSIEWSEQNEAKLNELFMKMMENKNKPVRHQNLNKDIKEERGGSNDQCKQKRNEKIRVEASGKKAEKKTEIAQKEKIQKNSTPLMNSRKEPLKPSVLKKPSSLPATRKSWSSSPSPRTPTAGTTPASRKPAGSKGEKSQPRTMALKTTPKPTQADGTREDGTRDLKNVKKTQSTIRKSIKPTETKVQTQIQTPEVKPSFYNKVTKKSSVVPLETKAFLRKGSGIGPGAGPVVIKAKVVDQPEEASRTSATLNDDTEFIMANDHTSEDEEKCEPQVVMVSPGPSLRLSPTKKCEETMSSDLELPAEVINENKEVEDDSDNNHEEEIIPCLLQTESPVIKVVVPAVSSSSQAGVRRSLSHLLQEESNEEAADVSEWGNAEHPPSLVYQRDSPKGFKRLLKFARKTKAGSALSEADDHHAEKSKGSRSIFSLSAFRVSKTNESKLASLT